MPEGGRRRPSTTRSIRVAAGAGAVLVTAGALLVGVPDPERTPANSARVGPALPPAVTAPPPSTSAPTPLGDRHLGGLRFTDITASAGLDAPHTGRTLDGAEVQTGGAAAGDYDADGDVDLFLTRVGLPDRLYNNDGSGRFTDVAARAGVLVASPADGSAGAVFADADGDGRLDLFVTGNGRNGHTLFRNQGDGTFIDVTADSGLGLPPVDAEVGSASYGSAFADWDHDGDLDLVTLQWYSAGLGAEPSRLDGTNDDVDDMCARADRARRRGAPADAPPTRSRLYRNQGGGRFVDVSSALGVDLGTIAGFTPTFADVDGDGWEDLLITGDFCTSRLYRNQEGRRFVDATEASGVGTDENGMGSVVEDIDGDGHLDWFVTSISYPTAQGGCPIVAASIGCSGNRLYLGNGRGRFTDGTDALGVRDGYWGWGAVAQDLDDDGARDLLVVNGYRDRPTGEAGADDPNAALYDRMDRDPSRLWLGGEPGPWPEVSEAVGLDDRANGKALVAFDLEGDGDLDLAAANTEDPPTLYRNDTPRRHHWLALRLRQPGPNGWAVGARIKVAVDADGPAIPLEARAGGSFQSGDPSDLHVGLGDAERVARIEIRWPGTSTPQVLTDVAADQVLTVRRP